MFEGLAGHIPTEALAEGVEQGLCPWRTGLLQTRASTTQFAAGKKTPCNVVNF
jgi:hypothetical protein